MTDKIILPIDIKAIPLTRGYETLVDATDYDWLMQWKWRCDIKGYAVRTKHIEYIKGKRKQKTILMHRVIMCAPDGIEVDHKNMNRLHNWRLNLRLANLSQNNMNRVSQKGSSSQYKGCSWNERDQKWQAKIGFNHKILHLGYFTTEIEAAFSYNNAAIKYHGEFARLNAINNIGLSTTEG